MLQPLLDEQGLGGNTQALIYFAVAKMGDKPQGGVTDANPEGLTAVTGKHAEAFAERLKANGLTCHVLGRDDYNVAMMEKLVWIWCAPPVRGCKCRGSRLPSMTNRTRQVSDIWHILEFVLYASSHATCLCAAKCLLCDRALASLYVVL
jgi:hypothetical protein